MNKQTQIAVLGIMGGALGIGLLAKIWVDRQIDQSDPLAELDGLLKKQTFKPAPTVVPPKKEAPSPEPATVATFEEIEEPEAAEILNDDFPLRYGSRGPRVSRLQVWLLRNYGWTGKVTGILDKKTESQMKRYLKTNALDRPTYQRLKLDAPVHQQKMVR